MCKHFIHICTKYLVCQSSLFLYLPPSGTAQHGLRDDDLTHGELTFLPPGMETKTPIRVGIQDGTLHTHTVIHTLQH